jgi:peptidyl-prolyl cis-trans isomerase SurA
MIYRQLDANLNRLLKAMPILVLVLILALAGTGCGRQQDTESQDSAKPSGAASAVDEPADSASDREAAAAHILVMHAESLGHTPDITRSRTEAHDRALRILMKVRDHGAVFEELARQYSDDPQVVKTGGYLGIFRRGQMDLAFDVAVFGLEVGQVSGAVETDYGWHIIRRLPVLRLRAHHIMFSFKGAANAAGGIKRTKPQAAALAEEVRLTAIDPNADLCELARKFSDDPNNRTTCGDLGIVEPGFLPRAFDKALVRLRPGDISKVVETEYGYHIIWRE